MIELFVIGASLAIMALHLRGRLTPIKGAEQTYTGSNTRRRYRRRSQWSAAGPGHGPACQTTIDRCAARLGAISVMTRKWWEHEDDIKLSDVKTHEDKLRYSRMMYRRWEEIGENESPGALLDFERFPEQTAEWQHPEWHIMIGRAERERLRLQGRAKRRMLRGG